MNDQKPVAWNEPRQMPKPAALAELLTARPHAKGRDGFASLTDDEEQPVKLVHAPTSTPELGNRSGTIAGPEVDPRDLPARPEIPPALPTGREMAQERYWAESRGNPWEID